VYTLMESLLIIDCLDSEVSKIATIVVENKGVAFEHALHGDAAAIRAFGVGCPLWRWVVCGGIGSAGAAHVNLVFGRSQARISGKATMGVIESRCCLRSKS
jgi:hypothetical protein